MRVVGLRFHRDGLADQPLGILNLSGLVADNPERMQRFEITRLRRKQVLVNPRGIAKPSSATQIQCVLQQGFAHARHSSRISLPNCGHRRLDRPVKVPTNLSSRDKGGAVEYLPPASSNANSASGPI